MHSGASGGARSATACITSLHALQAKIILVDFNLMVSTLTAKPPNLIPHQSLRLDGMVHYSNYAHEKY